MDWSDINQIFILFVASIS